LSVRVAWNPQAAPAIAWMQPGLPWSGAMFKPACLVLAASLTLCLAGTARAADEATLESYAAWAEGALTTLPPGVQLLEPLAQRLAELTSERREAAGGRPLPADPELLPAARAHALDMLERGYVDHVTPDGLEPGDRAALLHRRLVEHVGENLADLQGLSAEQLEGQSGPLAAKVVDGWMQSPGHRENILDPAYTHQAIAAAAKGEEVVMVQLFAAWRALLAEPLPLRVRRGVTLPLRFEQGQALEVPVQYAYARPGQPAQELVTLDLAIADVPVEPGAYFLKFLFPGGQAGRFEVVAGPAILVR
jgi:uncharacterized protein YkwD